MILLRSFMKTAECMKEKLIKQPSLHKAKVLLITLIILTIKEPLKKEKYMEQAHFIGKTALVIMENINTVKNMGGELSITVQESIMKDSGLKANKMDQEYCLRKMVR